MVAGAADIPPANKTTNAFFEYIGREVIIRVQISRIYPRSQEININGLAIVHKLLRFPLHLTRNACLQRDKHRKYVFFIVTYRNFRGDYFVLQNCALH